MVFFILYVGPNFCLVLFYFWLKKFLSIFHYAGILVTDSLRICFSEKNVSYNYFKRRFGFLWISWLSFIFYFLCTLKISLHCFLACILYDEKFYYIIIFAPLYIMCFLSCGLTIFYYHCFSVALIIT